MSALKWLGIFWLVIVMAAAGCFVLVVLPDFMARGYTQINTAPSVDEVKHRLDAVEEDLGRAEERIAALQQAVAENRDTQAALAAKLQEQQTAPAVQATQPAPDQVSAPPPAPPNPPKPKPVARRRAPSAQRMQYPHGEKVYPWTYWENPPPAEGER